MRNQRQNPHMRCAFFYCKCICGNLYIVLYNVSTDLKNYWESTDISPIRRTHWCSWRVCSAVSLKPSSWHRWTSSWRDCTIKVSQMFFEMKVHRSTMHASYCGLLLELIFAFLYYFFVPLCLCPIKLTTVLFALFLYFSWSLCRFRVLNWTHLWIRLRQSSRWPNVIIMVVHVD